MNRSEMTSLVRQLTGHELEDLVPNNRIHHYLNASLTALRGSVGEFLPAASVTVPVVGATVALPGNLATISGAVFTPAGGKAVQLPRLSRTQAATMSGPGPLGYTHLPGSHTVELVPAPTTLGTLVVLPAQGAIGPLSSDSAVPADVPEDYHMALVYSAASRLAEEQGDETGMAGSFQARHDELLGGIRARFGTVLDDDIITFGGGAVGPWWGS
jgi:hypothetical protein